ncbi:MAG: hypothetical protein KDK34_02820 [Leptospiraceae bacterium]|nr:hypothetical protein [Leptospiraceae bacterium]
MASIENIKSRWERHQRRLQIRGRRLSSGSAALAGLRFVTFFCILILPVGLHAFDLWVWPWAALPSIALVPLFVLLVRKHRRLRTVLRHLEMQGRYCTETLNRCAPDWWQRLTNEFKAEAEANLHDYAQDLNITGRFSLFRWLDRCAIPTGRSVLHDWLLAQPDQSALDVDRWRRRQNAVRLMTSLRLFRLRWYRQGLAFLEKHRTLFELDWLHALQSIQVPHLPSVFVWFSRVLALITIGSYIGFSMDWNPAYFMLTLPVQVLIFLWIHYRGRTVARTFAPVADQLTGFDQMFQLAERIPAVPDWFQDHQIFGGRTGASGEHVTGKMRSLTRTAFLLSIRNNPFLHVMCGILFLYETNLLYRLERWLNRHRQAVLIWFAELAELDAFLALGNAADFQTDQTWPELIEQQSERSGQILAARSLAHPLLPPAQRVANDVRIGAAEPIWLITGSNMSGKSTFLRTVGINWILAMMGATVTAREFSFQARCILTSMSQQDDLSQSISLFYAEVRKIKLLQDKSHERNPPSVLLLDEMLRGTNARERTIASRSILQQFCESPAVVLAATHDMDLVNLCTEQSRIVCYHFQEQINSGRMQFDYLLKQGPVTGTNALKIMEQEGIRL